MNGKTLEKKFFSKSQQNHEKLDSFLDSLIPNSWNFISELKRFSVLKTKAFSEFFLSYLKESLSIQNIMKLHLGVKISSSSRSLPLHPFGDGISSRGSFVQSLFLAHNDKDLRIVQDEFSGGVSSKSSRIELEYITYIQNNLNDFNHVNAISSPTGQMRLGKKVVADNFTPLDPPLKSIAWFMQGCLWHGHSKDTGCIGRFSEKSENHFIPFRKSTLKQLFEETQTKLDSIRDSVEVIEMWECEWNEFKAKNEHIRLMVKDVENPGRLIPRAAVHGGLMDAIFFHEISTKDRKIFFLDMNQQYSHVAVEGNFPIGLRKVIRGKALEDIFFREGKLFYKEAKKEFHFIGQLYCRILPPKDLFFPFLFATKKEGNKKCKKRKYSAISSPKKNPLSANVLCFTCFQEGLTDPCNHSDFKRSFVGVFGYSELNYALSLGYKILKKFEAHIFLKEENIFSEFAKILIRRKILASPLEDNFSLIEYCEIVNDALRLSGTLKVTPKDFKEDESKKIFSKLDLNILWGRLISKFAGKSTLILESHLDLVENCERGDIIIEDLISSDSKEKCFLTIEKKLRKDFISTNQVYIGTEIVARGRIILHKKICEVQEKGGKVLYFDTDSILFLWNPTQPLPFQISNTLPGFWKHEKQNIQEYACLGLKSYALKYEINGKEYFDVKVCGLAFHNQQEKKEGFEDIKNIIKGNIASKSFPQKKRKIEKQKYFMVESKFRLRLNNYKKRYLKEEKLNHFQSFPFGSSKL